MTLPAPLYNPPNDFAWADLSLDAICVVDMSGRFVHVSAACLDIFGYTPAEMVGRTISEMVHPEDRVKTLEAASGVMSGVNMNGFENRYIRKDGQVVHIMWTARWSDADNLRIGVARDVTVQKHAESIRHAAYFISEAANGTDDLAVLSGRIYEFVKEYTRANIFSVAIHEPQTETLNFFHCGAAAAQLPHSANMNSFSGQVMQSDQPVYLTPTLRGTPQAGHWPDISAGALHGLGVPLKSRELRGALVLQDHSGIAGYSPRNGEFLLFIASQLGAAIDRIQMQTRYRRMALYDRLTGLPNRELMHDRLSTAIERASR